jgi:hypothetical protein
MEKMVPYEVAPEFNVMVIARKYVAWIESRLLTALATTKLEVAIPRNTDNLGSARFVKPILN